ncbi:MAG: single-stranded DNA-binding protein [Acidimicrobiales bacterium]
MAVGNTVTLVGNVTRDPELRFTPAGRAVANFGLAVNFRSQRNGEWQESTSFFDIVCWGELGENASESIQKGTRVLVTGRLEQRSWQTQEGDRRSKIEVIADEVGPSLRWATAAVTKTERRGGDEYAPAAAAPAPAAVGGRGGRGEPAPGYYDDEEPF